MAIKYELKQKIEKETRRLGTRADSYLEEFYDATLENGKLSNFDQLISNSERFSKASEATIKQAKETYLVFGIIDINGNFTINDFKNKEEFKSEVTISIKSLLEFPPTFSDTWRNTYKLFNNFIYINAVDLLKVNKWNVEDFFDESIEKRISEFRTSLVIFDDEINSLIKTQFNLLLERCGYNIETNNKTELNSYIKNIIEEQKYEDKNIKNNKDCIDIKVRTSFELIDMVLDDKTPLTIPFYQREYVWTPDLIENFLVEISDNRKSMLNIGNILISIIGKGQNQEYALVDGQQRITSLILIFNVISKHLSKTNLENFPTELTTIVNKCKTSSMIKTLKNISNKEYIEDLTEVLNCELNKVDKLNDSSVIKINYKIVNSFIRKFDIESIKNLFIKLNYVLSTTTSDQTSDEIELFISTNSSRRPLTNYDLIRSYLISKIDDNEETENIENKLNTLNNLLSFDQRDNEKEKDIFFKVYLDYIEKINSEDSSSIKDIFKRFRKSRGPVIQSNDDLELLLDEIISIANSYRIIKGIDVDEKIYFDDFFISLGQGLKSTSIYDIFFIFFVEELKKIIDEKERIELLNEFRKILLKIEQFEIKWKLFTFRGDSLSNSMGRLFSQFYFSVYDLLDNNDYSEISLKFDETLTTSESFVNDVLTRKENENVISFRDSLESVQSQVMALKILNRVSFNLFNDGIEYKKNSKNYFSHKSPSIEHIFPRTHTKWAEDNKTNADQLIPYLENIGNKFIYNKDDNASAGNKTFLNKIKHYKKNNDIKLDKTLKFKYEDEHFDLLSKVEWTIKDIELREKFIITYLLEIWNK